MSRRGIERVKGVESNVAGQARGRARSTQQAATSPPRNEEASKGPWGCTTTAPLRGPPNATRRNAISSTSIDTYLYALFFSLVPSESFLSTSGQPLPGDI